MKTPHKTPKLLCLMTLALALGLASAVPADEVVPLYGRLSALKGEPLIMDRRADEWSYARLNELVQAGDAFRTDENTMLEIEIPGGVFLRLGEMTSLDVVAVNERRFRLWQGSAYVTVPDHAPVVTIETPVGAVLIVGGSLVRIDVEEDGPAVIHAFQGKAQVLGADESSIALIAGLSLHVDDDGDFIALVPIDRADRDALDRWNHLRDQVYADLRLPDFIPPETVGAYDLVREGQWIVDDGIRYWRPRVEPSWRPYYVGAWSHVEPVGWYWVPTHAFEYATSHFGAWRHSVTLGWLWRPTWRWVPSRVAWLVHDDGVFWAPLGYHGRPVNVSTSLLFSIRLATGDPFAFNDVSWCYAPLVDFRSSKPHFTVVNYTTVISRPVFKVHRFQNVRSVATINHLDHIRPPVLAHRSDLPRHGVSAGLKKHSTPAPRRNTFYADVSFRGDRFRENLDTLRNRLSRIDATPRHPPPRDDDMHSRERREARTEHFKEKLSQPKSHTPAKVTTQQPHKEDNASPTTATPRRTTAKQPRKTDTPDTPSAEPKRPKTVRVSAGPSPPKTKTQEALDRTPRPKDPEVRVSTDSTTPDRTPRKENAKPDQSRPRPSTEGPSRSPSRSAPLEQQKYKETPAKRVRSSSPPTARRTSERPRTSLKLTPPREVTPGADSPRPATRPSSLAPPRRTADDARVTPPRSREEIEALLLQNQRRRAQRRKTADQPRKEPTPRKEK